MAVAALAGVGGGALIAALTALQTVVLGTLPFAGAEQIVAISEVRDGEAADTTFGNYRDYHSASPFQALGGIVNRPPLLFEGAAPHSLLSAAVDPGFFEVLGLDATIGRVFNQSDIDAGAPVAMLTTGVWRSVFASSESVLSTTVALDGVAYTVVGIVDERIRFLTDADVLIPFPHRYNGRGQRAVRVLGRIPAQLTIERVADAMSASVAALEQVSPENAGFNAARLTPISDEVFGDRRPPLIAICVLALGLLLASFAGAISLVAADGGRRARVIAIKSSVGATRRTLIADALLELAATTAVGMAGAVAVAASLTWAISFGLQDPVVAQQLRTTPLSVALGLAGVMFVVAAAISPTVALSATSLKLWSGVSGRQHTAATRFGPLAHDGVLLIQTAIATALALVSLSVSTELWRISAVDLGFNSNELLTIQTKTYPGAYRRVEGRRDAIAIVDAVAGLPGVAKAAGASSAPLVGLPVSLPFKAKDVQTEGSERVQFRLVTPGYFDLLGLRMVSGRAFDARDSAGAPYVVVVNTALARRYWGDRATVGREVQIAGGPWFSVAGVVEDAPPSDRFPARPTLYMSALQASNSGEMTVLFAATGRTPAIDEVRNAITAAVAGVAVSRYAPFDDLLAEPERPRRFAAAASSGLAVVAVMLSLWSLYALSSQTAASRQRELAIRLACGASDYQLAGQHARATLVSYLIGVLAGVAAAAAAHSSGYLPVGTISRAAPFWVGACVLFALAGTAIVWLPFRNVFSGQPWRLLVSD